jgi:hypothetical protein
VSYSIGLIGLPQQNHDTSISKRLNGPFFVFKKGDRDPDRHFLLSSNFKKCKPVKGRNLLIKLKGNLLKLIMIQSMKDLSSMANF